MPSPSYWPIVLAVGLPIMAYGVIYSHVCSSPSAALILLLAMFGWALEPSVADEADYDPPPRTEGPAKELATIG